MGTATSVLECSTRYPHLPEVNCSIGSVGFGDFQSNPAITGVGTDISFVLTAGLSLLACSSVQILCDRLGHHRWRRFFFEPLVTSFSDQQIVRGIALSVATLYTSAACTLDAYRYDVVCQLLLMTIVSHLAAELAARRAAYAGGYRVLAVVRFGLIGCQVVFAGLVFGARLTPAFPTAVPPADQARNTTLVLPAVCFDLLDAEAYSGLEDVARGNHKDIAGFSSYLVLAIFYFAGIAFTLVEVLTHFLKRGTVEQVRDMEDRAPRWTWFWWLRLIRGLILLAAWIIWAWAVTSLYQLRAWMNGSGWMGEQAALDEEGLTFGQLMSILLLMAAPLSLVNTLNSYKDREREEKDTTATTTHQKTGFHPYQPLYQGSQTEMEHLTY